MSPENNWYGIYLYSSSSNTIYNNYFNNMNNAYDDGSNIWNIGKTLGTNITALACKITKAKHSLTLISRP